MIWYFILFTLKWFFFHKYAAYLNVKPVDFRVLVESGEESVDVDAGHDDLRYEELNIQLKLKETFLK